MLLQRQGTDMFGFKRKQGKLKKTNNYLRPKVKLGLALSGGGARGFGHIGAFKAFEENHIRFDYVAGTSVGSIMGAAYCAGIPWQKMRDFSLTVEDRDLIDKRFIKIGSRSSNIEDLMRRLIGDTTFEQLQIPFSAVAVDLISGNEIVLNSGSVAKACSASSAVPAVFKPVQYDDMMLVDGGLLNNIPADTVRHMGAEVVIAVDLNHTRGEGTTSTGMWSTLMASWRILMKATAFKGQMNSDIIIEPELKEFKNTSIGDVDSMIEEGYRATLKKMDEIKYMLGLER